MFEDIRKFREKLASGRFCAGASITLSDPAVTEALGKSVDFFWIDTEHTPLSLESLQAHLIAARAVGVPALVRVPASEVWFIKRVLDTGAQGLIVPQVRSAQEVRRVVEACRYQPLGDRGFGPRRAFEYGREDVDQYIQAANRDLFVAAQIENVDAYQDLDAILMISGLDSIVIGPYDLSASMGLLGKVTHPQVAEAIAAIIRKAREKGLFVGMGMGPDEDHALWAARLGVQWVQCGCDFGYLIKFADQLFDRVRRAGS
ncbi:MAG: 4-hydroxy-3-methylbut-2-en-1-yl diphosphate synthase [Planctomycetes bacterium]|nr:4-hydroxy-3-methylbut-2-en-1-yl diphosphate synthase [Planctomycetota bacterium]